jgi:hypothetical protein
MMHRGAVEDDDDEDGEEKGEYGGVRRSVGAGAGERARAGLAHWRRRVGTPVSEGEVVTDDDEDEGLGEGLGPESDAMRPAFSPPRRPLASPRGAAEESSHARRHRDALRALLQEEEEEEEEEGVAAGAQSRAAGGQGEGEAAEDSLPILPNALTEVGPIFNDISMA